MSQSAWRRYWSRLDWVQELTYLALLATEACVIHPWQVLVHAWLDRQAIPFWALCALICFSMDMDACLQSLGFHTPCHT